MFYKIIHGFSPEDYIEIGEKELQKAYYCFLMKKDSLFSGGSVKGNMIQEIKPDFHRIMGWNRGYKLEALDYEELAHKGIDRKCRQTMLEEKDTVQYLIETKQEKLIGSYPKLQIAHVGKIEEGMKSLESLIK